VVSGHAGQLSHQEPAAFAVDREHVRDEARALARESLRDRGLVVEEREDRLEVDGLSVPLAAQDRGQRPGAQLYER
jgi:hypothetical protein